MSKFRASAPDTALAVWRKSSHSEESESGGECVEVASFSGGVAIRDSTRTHDPALPLTTTNWRELIVRIKHGELDL
jgi:hypothetical protein